MNPLAEGRVFHAVFAVTEAVYEGFLATFGDRNPLHVDDAYAQARGFRAKVMHGNILNGFVSDFVGMQLPLRDVLLLSQEIRYRQPVYAGEVLRLEATVRHYSEGTGIAELQFRFRNSEESTVASGSLQLRILFPAAASGNSGAGTNLQP
jgi:3-hydroxybutyryl-CoA dehydratase